MATVYIPSQLRKLTGGAERVEAAGRSLGRVIDELEAAHPALLGRIRQNDRLAPGLAVSIDGAVSSRGMLATIEPASEIHFLPAIGGG